MTVRTIEVRERVMARNDELAAGVRARLAEHGVVALNLMSSPGSGKTTLLERTLAVLGEPLDIAVVTGDCQTQNDADRLAAHTARLVQAVWLAWTVAAATLALPVVLFTSALAGMKAAAEPADEKQSNRPDAY